MYSSGRENPSQSRRHVKRLLIKVTSHRRALSAKNLLRVCFIDYNHPEGSVSDGNLSIPKNRISKAILSQCHEKQYFPAPRFNSAGWN